MTPTTDIFFAAKLSLSPKNGVAGLESVPAEEKAAAGGGIKNLQCATDPQGLDRSERGDRWRRYRARLKVWWSRAGGLKAATNAGISS